MQNTHHRFPAELLPSQSDVWLALARVILRGR